MASAAARAAAALSPAAARSAAATKDRPAAAAFFGAVAALVAVALDTINPYKNGMLTMGAAIHNGRSYPI